MSADYLQANQPDILEVIANLSNDAVFTPPRVVNAVLDLLPEEVWHDPTLRWLDPGSKTGVFPREITKRLMVGLADALPNEGERLRHILTEMVFAIATEEITGLMSRRSLYCSKDASSEYSVASFTSKDGNVWQKRVKHSWDSEGKCTECKGSMEQLLVPGRDNKAYGFIHADGRKQIDKEMEMKFDVIVGNPPYQMDAEGGNRTMPIYNIFVGEAKKLNPRFITMIIPSRWMAGGLGLTEFRNEMLADKRLRKIVDYAKMESLFPGVDFEGGVCYFLWDRDSPGECEVTFTQDDVLVGPLERDLSEYDIFVRDARALSILRKVLDRKGASLAGSLSSRTAFGVVSNYSDYSESKRPGDVRFYATSPKGRVEAWIRRSEAKVNLEGIDVWKAMVPSAYGERGTIPAQVIGPPMIGQRPSICTQSFLYLGTATREEAESVISYYRTRFLRFLVSLRKITQHTTSDSYSWVPQQSWDRVWTDAELYKKYGITKEEQAYIESMVKEMAA